MGTKEIIIFCDGASKGNPGRGGWGALVLHDGILTELGGFEEHTTNNRMELTAALEALRFVQTRVTPPVPSVRVYSDSSYFINGLTKWIFGWKKNGWVTAAKKEVENRDLWEALDFLAQSLRPACEYVAGHAGVPGNERVDVIASSFAEKIAVPLFEGAIAGYPISLSVTAAMSTPSTQKKGTSSSRSRATAYSYVSAVGGVVQTHATWSQCEARVKGVAGARYKKALNQDEEALLLQEFARGKK